MNGKEFISHSIEETKAVAQELVNFLAAQREKDAAAVIALHGDLGAGKTALVKCIAEIMGITETVTSPTFVIMKQYQTPVSNPPLREVPRLVRGGGCLVHIDAYRLESARELEVLGFKELLKDLSKIIFIEWPEHVKDILPKETISIQCEFVDESTRRYRFLLS